MNREQVEKIYLGTNGFALIALGIWCAADPHGTADIIGLRLEGPRGLAEYFAVYGGIQIGLGSFFLASLSRLEWRFAGVLLGVCVYGGIVLLRGLSMILNGPTSGVGWVLYALEVSCFLVGMMLLRAGQSHSQSKTH